MGLFNLFGGRYPSTKKYEAQQQRLVSDYERYKELAVSEQVKRFDELNKIVNSPEFKKRVDELKNQKFSSTEAYQKESEYKRMGGSRDIKSYNKFVGKGNDKKMAAILASQEYARYEELKALVNSAEFKQKQKVKAFEDTPDYKTWRKYQKLSQNSTVQFALQNKDVQSEDPKMAKKIAEALRSSKYTTYISLEKIVNTPEFEKKREVKAFKDTPDYALLKEYEQLQKSSDIKYVVKTADSDEYKNYKQLNGSERLQKYEALAAYVASPDFINYKAEIEDPKRYKKSDECKLVEEFEALSKNADVVWYKKSLAANAFAEEKKWKLVFEDNFDSLNLDTNKWQSGYYWGNQLLGDSYSPLGELQAYKKENIHIANSVATLQTTLQPTKGKVWDPAQGFVDGDFDYTSALINTGAAFRQQYGRFEFKVKMSKSAPVTHNIWMVGKTSAPHINVVNFGLWRKKVALGLITNEHKKMVEVDGANFSSDFYIFSLLWTPEKLVWSINGVEVQTITTDVPRQEMYIVLSSNVNAKSNVQNATMDIDWVRCYTWNNDNEAKA